MSCKHLNLIEEVTQVQSYNGSWHTAMLIQVCSDCGKQVKMLHDTDAVRVGTKRRTIRKEIVKK